MTSDEFAEALSRLVGEAEDAGLDPRRSWPDRGHGAAERSSMSPAPNSVLHSPRCLGGRRPHVLGVRSASRALDAAVNSRLAKWRDYSMDSTSPGDHTGSWQREITSADR